MAGFLLSCSPEILSVESAQRNQEIASPRFQRLCGPSRSALLNHEPDKLLALTRRDAVGDAIELGIQRTDAQNVG